MCRLMAVMLCITGCGATSMLSTWKKPGAPPLSFQKVLVIAPVTDEATRRSIEDEVAARLLRATPSYAALGSSTRLTIDNVRDHLRLADYDGALVVRIAAVEKESNWVQGGPRFGAWAPYDPGHVSIDTYVRVETDIYSLPDEQLLFSATSRTANPDSLAQLVDETSRAVREELKKAGLVGQPVSRR